MTMVMSGPQCLVKNGPGHAEFRGLLPGRLRERRLPRRCTGQDSPRDGEGDDRHVPQMAELGVPFATEMKIEHAKPSGPMAEMMKKMANTISTEVTSVSTAPIEAAMFEVPAGYKVNKR